MTDEEEKLCANCDRRRSECRNFYRLDNGDCVCSRACFVEYAGRYFDVWVDKGKPFKYLEEAK